MVVIASTVLSPEIIFLIRVQDSIAYIQGKSLVSIYEWVRAKCITSVVSISSNMSS